MNADGSRRRAVLIVLFDSQRVFSIFITDGKTNHQPLYRRDALEIASIQLYSFLPRVVDLIQLSFYVVMVHRVSCVARPEVLRTSPMKTARWVLNSKSNLLPINSFRCGRARMEIRVLFIDWFVENRPLFVNLNSDASRRIASGKLKIAAQPNRKPLNWRSNATRMHPMKH